MLDVEKAEKKNVSEKDRPGMLEYQCFFRGRCSSFIVPLTAEPWNDWYEASTSFLLY
jgi:hypothetical protein